MNKHASVTSIVNVEPSPYENKQQDTQATEQDQDAARNVFLGSRNEDPDPRKEHEI